MLLQGQVTLPSGACFNLVQVGDLQAGDIFTLCYRCCRFGKSGVKQQFCWHNDYFCCLVASLECVLSHSNLTRTLLEKNLPSIGVLFCDPGHLATPGTCASAGFVGSEPMNSVKEIEVVFKGDANVHTEEALF